MSKLDLFHRLFRTMLPLVFFLLEIFIVCAIIHGNVSDAASALVFHGNLEPLDASRLADAIVNRTSEVYRVNADDVVVEHKVEYCQSPMG